MDLQAPHPPSVSPHALTIAGWSAFVVAGGIFLAIAWSVSTRSPLVSIDAKVAAWLHTHASPAITKFMLVVTHANSTGAAAAWALIFGAILWRMRERYWLGTLALAVGGGAVLNVLLKYAYERARPHFEDPLIHLDSFSFPSGHTAGAVMFYGVLAAFMVSRSYRPAVRAAWVAAAIAMVVLVAFSRMYLGAHYLSDVAAAACSSTVWLVLCLHTVHGWVRRRIAAGAH